jgi:hypothetical protein
MQFNFENLFNMVEAVDGVPAEETTKQALAAQILNTFQIAKAVGYSQYEIIEAAFLLGGVVASDRTDEEHEEFIRGDLSTEPVSDERAAERLAADEEALLYIDSDLGASNLAGDPAEEEEDDPSETGGITLTGAD